MLVLKPMDVILMDGKKYNPLHTLVGWRCIDPSVHCVTALGNRNGLAPTVFSSELSGIEIQSVYDYLGRNISVHRYRKPFDVATLMNWTHTTRANSKGYDLFRQWFLGFILGVDVKTLADDPIRWTCAELAYWAFQENGYRLTERDEVLPMPRLFRYHLDFECLFEGELTLDVL
jgi:hypothetical protein